MKKGITFIGLDAHKEQISVAMLLPGADKPVEWKCVNERAAVRRMLRKVNRLVAGEVRFCYEAGPCGFALQRWIREEGGSCIVVAPSLIPRKPGDRVKTDRRDAHKLAELLRAGLLTEVHPPTAADEAVRDLCRAREDAHEDVVRCQHRLATFVLRRGLTWRGGKAWSKGHRLWLRSLRFEQAADRHVVDEYLLAIEQMEQRLKTLDEHVEAASKDAPYATAVAALRCFRGIDTLTAMTLVTELHSFMRFESPRQLMAYLGLVTTEHSSGDSKRRGGITKTGNSHARRVLVETSWHYRHKPAIGVRLAGRRKGAPPHAVAIADKAMVRLHRRFHRLLEKGKPRPKVVVAIARELVGFVWAALQPNAA